MIQDFNKLDAALCIADIFNNCAEQGITSISTREILGFLGITNPDFEYENVVYDLTPFLSKQTLNKFEDEIYHSDYFNGRKEIA